MTETAPEIHSVPICSGCREIPPGELLTLSFDSDGVHCVAVSDEWDDSTAMARPKILVCADCHRSHIEEFEYPQTVVRDWSPRPGTEDFTVFGFSDLEADGRGQMAEMGIIDHRRRPPGGVWHIMYNVDSDSVVVEFGVSTRHIYDYEISGSMWRSDPVRVVSALVGRELALKVEPHLELPTVGRSPGPRGDR